MRKLLKKSLAVILSATMVLATPIISSASDPKLPTPMYTFDFESESDDLTFVTSNNGTIELVDDIERGGKVLKISDGGTAVKGENYVKLPEDIFTGVTADTGASVSMWVNIPVDTFAWSVLFSSTANGYNEWGLTKLNANLVADINAGNPWAYGGTGNDSTDHFGSWHFVTLTITKDVMTVYVDGVAAKTAVASGGAATYATDGWSGVLNVLANNKFNVLGAGGFPGDGGTGDRDIQDCSYDDVSIFAQALTADEVAILYSGVYTMDKREAIASDFAATLDVGNQEINITYNELISGGSYALTVSKDGAAETTVDMTSPISVTGFEAGTYKYTLTVTKDGYLDTVLTNTLKLTTDEGIVVNDNNLLSGVSSAKGTSAYTVAYATPVVPDSVTMKVEANGSEVSELAATATTVGDSFIIPFNKLTSNTAYTITVTAVKAGSATKTGTTQFTYVSDIVPAVYDSKVAGFYSFDDSMLNDVTKVAATTVGSKISSTASSSVIGFVEGINGKAASFTGAGSDGLELDVAPTSKNYTISFAVKTATPNQGVTPAVFVGAKDQTVESWLAVKTGDWGSGSNGPMVWSKTDGSYYDLPAGDDAIVSSLTANTWANVAVVIDGAAGKIYVDGKKTYEGTVAAVISSATKVFLGVNAWDTPFEGAIDNLSIINTNIDAATVKALSDANSNPDGIKMVQDNVATVISVSSVTLNKPSDTLIAGNTLQLRATVAPANATNKAVTWKSTNTSVAIVDANGKVTAKKAGSATITATAADGSKRSAECKITVKAKTTAVTVKAAGYTLKGSKIYLVKGKNVTLNSTVSPTTATKGVTYKVTSGTKNVTVTKAGKITAKKVGTSKVKVTSNDKLKSKTITVVVVNKAKANTKLTVNKLTVKKGATKKLSVTVSAKTTEKVTYKVKKGATYAKVDKYGYVTGKKKGTATITVKCGSKTKTVNVTVSK